MMRASVRSLIGAAVLAALLAGCARPTLPDVEPRPALPPPTAPVDDLSLAEARQAAVYYQARVAALEQSAAAERIETQRRLLSWASGLALLAALACTVLAFVVPVGRKTLITAALACAGVVVVAWLLGQVLTWLPLLGIGAAVAALGWLGWLLWRRLRVAIGTVETAIDRDDPSWESLKTHIKHQQGRLQAEFNRLAERLR